MMLKLEKKKSAWHALGTKYRLNVTFIRQFYDMHSSFLEWIKTSLTSLFLFLVARAFVNQRDLSFFVIMGPNPRASPFHMMPVRQGVNMVPFVLAWTFLCHLPCWLGLPMAISMIIWLVRKLCSFLKSCHLCFYYLFPFKELSQVASAANNKLPSDFLLTWLGAPENEWNQSPMLLEFMKTEQLKKLQRCLFKNRGLCLPSLCVKWDT